MRRVWDNPGRMAWRPAVAGVLALGLLQPGFVAAQGDARAAASGPQFEVTTIKPAPTGPMSMMGLIDTADGVHAENVTLPMLVRFAYGYDRFPTDDRVAGAPAWKDEKFNIEAKMSAADIAASAEMTKTERDARRMKMLQSMLEERLKLKVHFDSKQVPTYDLVEAKGGAKLKDTAEGQNDPKGIKDKDGKPMAGSWMRFQMDELVVQQYSMKQLAAFLSQPTTMVGRPVLDRTGLTGEYNFVLHWVYPGMHVNGAPAGAGEGPSIFTVLQDDLGLRLQASNGSVETVVIDHVEKPTEN